MFFATESQEKPLVVRGASRRQPSVRWSVATSACTRDCETPIARTLAL
jgi:hypothetical protein